MEISVSIVAAPRRGQGGRPVERPAAPGRPAWPARTRATPTRRTAAAAPRPAPRAVPVSTAREQEPRTEATASSSPRPQRGLPLCQRGAVARRLDGGDQVGPRDAAVADCDPSPPRSRSWRLSLHTVEPVQPSARSEPRRRRRSCLRSRGGSARERPSPPAGAISSASYPASSIAARSAPSSRGAPATVHEVRRRGRRPPPRRRPFLSLATRSHAWQGIPATVRLRLSDEGLTSVELYPTGMAPRVWSATSR